VDQGDPLHPAVEKSQTMDIKQLVVFMVQISIAATVLGFGLRATIGDLLYLVRRPGLLARSLLAMLVIMPIVAIVLAQAFAFRPAIEIALVALSISPVPPLLPNREGKAGGLAAYGISLMVTMGALSIVSVPVAVEMLEAILGREFATAASAIAGAILAMILVPLSIGVAIRTLAPAVANRLARPTVIIGNVLLVLGALPLLAAALPAMWRIVGEGTIVAIVLFVAIGLAIGHLLGGPEPDHAAVLALSTACRHPAIGFAIASANFPEERFGAAILLYLILNVIIAIPYISWQRRHLLAAAPTA
jgi:bile acid:Na+ symporter, BASS family